MRWLRWVVRRRAHTAAASPRTRAEVGAEPPALVTAPWYAYMATVAETGFWSMLCKLPSLTLQSLRLSWSASRLDTAITIACNVVSGVFSAFGLLATAGVLEALFAAGPTPARVRAALPALLVVAAAAAARSGASVAAGWAQSRLRPQVEVVTGARIFELTTRVELAAFDDSTFYDTLRGARDRGVRAASAVVSACTDVLTGVVGVAASAAALAVLHPVLLVLLVLASLPQGVASVRAAHINYSSWLRRIAVRRRKWMVADLMAERDSAPDVRAFTVGDFLLGEYGQLARYERDAELVVSRRQTTARVVGDLLGGIATGLVYAALAALLTLGSIPLAVAGTAVLAIRAGRTALSSLVFAVNRVYEEGLYLGDYNDFVAEATRRLPRPGLPAPPDGFSAITVEEVRFAYPGADSPALDGVSLRVRRGEVIALVGENGSGKTTLAKLLAGLYVPDAGSVRWDGVATDKVDRDRLRGQVAVIGQEFTRWPFTARVNITIGRHDRPHTDAAVHAAARAAGADTVIGQLTDGYDTLLDRTFKGGHELSGGQWQRIAIARAFYRDAALLICDEPTANLDPRAEHALYEQIRAHAGGRTVVLITHRLASTRFADRIYVLEHGRVSEQGTHEQLMTAGGTYAELFTLQASAYHATPATPAPR